MKPLTLLSAAIVAAFTQAAHAATADSIPIVKTSSAALTVEATAARELGEFLRIVYPQMTFPVVTEIPARGDCILFGTRASLPLLAKRVTEAEVAAPGSFVVKHVKQDGRTLGRDLRTRFARGHGRRVAVSRSQTGCRVLLQ